MIKVIESSLSLFVLTVFLSLSAYPQTCPGSPGCPYPTFNAANPISAGGGIQFVITGDFNGDGNPDLAISGGSVNVLLNNGLGGFGAPIPSGIIGWGIAAADFNQDGHLDLAVANEQGVGLLYGNGTGSFGQPFYTYAAGYPGIFGSNALATADLNGDSRPDLLVNQGWGADLATVVLINNGVGLDFTAIPVFAEYVWYEDTMPPLSVADFDGNGTIDFVAVNSERTVLYKNDGIGNFTAIDFWHPYSNSGQFCCGYPSIATADFNGDNKSDLVYNQGGVYFSDGNNLISNGGSPILGPVQTGDLNLDGKMDIVTDRGVMLGGGTGNFPFMQNFEPSIIGNDADHYVVSDMVVSDLNHDSKPDIAILKNDGTIIVLINTTQLTLPTISAGEVYAGFEGSAIALNNANVSELNQGSLSVGWRVNSSLCSISAPTSIHPSVTCADNGNFVATLTANDGINPPVSSNAAVMVSNVAPTLDAINVVQVLVPVNTEVNTSAAFTDPGSQDTHTAVWNWGDGLTSSGSISEANGSGSANSTHIYNLAGIYTVRLKVTDDDGAPSNESVYEYVVVYDATAGFVTGSGSIKSLAGSYLPNPTATGTGKFGFTSKYTRNGSLESETEFELAAVHFHFHSDNAQWLVITGAKGEYQGTGMVEGSSHHYGYTLTLIDGQTNGGGGYDKFRLRIWDMDNGNAIVYDSQMWAAANVAPTTLLTKGDVKIKR